MTLRYSLETIDEAAVAVASLLGEHTVVALQGTMGVGKTTFIKALCAALGVESEVNSPSFAILNEYSSPRREIKHFDLYRMRSIAEAYDIGIEDYLYSGDLCLIEWADIIAPLLPENTLYLHITQEDGVCTLTANI